MKVALAQTKPVTGDLEGNLEQILEDIERAKREDADIVLFPETAITGYCCGALYQQEGFVEYNKAMLEEIIAPSVPDDMVAVVGFVDIKGQKKDGFPDLRNSVAVIQGGKVVDTYDKVLLANSNQHEDLKYFTPGEEVKTIPVQLHGETVRLGTPICEDVWYQDHDRDVVAEMVEQGADIILSPNQSYYHYGKQQLRRWLFGGHAARNEVPVVSVNAVGVGDILKNIMVYDGGSTVFGRHGTPLAELKRFARDFQVVDVETAPAIKPPAIGKYQEIYESIVFGQKEFFTNCGSQRAQVHLSGGVDSSVVAPMVADAMGAENTVFISNPTKDNGQQTQSDAQYVADQLNVPLHWNPTQGPYESVVQTHADSFGVEPTLTGKACIQATLRTVQGIAASHTYKTGIVATGNHTEIVEGWASFHDIGSIGVWAPMGDLLKVEVFRLGEYINERFGREIVPKHLYDGTTQPAAELADAQEDPLDYYVRSGIDAEFIRNRRSVTGLIQSFREQTLTEEFFPLHPNGKSVYERYDEDGFAQQVREAFRNSKTSVYKAGQGAPSMKHARRSRGFSNRETIINGYQGEYDIAQLKNKFLVEVAA